MQIVTRHFGKFAGSLYAIMALLCYLVFAAWHVVVFVFPPGGQPLWPLLVVVGSHMVTLPSLAAIEISRREQGCSIRRIARVLFLTGSWFEFATDAASGIAAVRDSKTYIWGIALLVVGAPRRHSYLMRLIRYCSVLCTHNTCNAQYQCHTAALIDEVLMVQHDQPCFRSEYGQGGDGVQALLSFLLPASTHTRAAVHTASAHWLCPCSLSCQSWRSH